MSLYTLSQVFIKKFLVLLFFILIYQVGETQPINKVKIYESDLNIGTNLLLDSKFPTKQYSFTKLDILNFRFYHEFNQLVVHAGFRSSLGDLRMNSYAFGYDLKARGIAWSLKSSAFEGESIHLGKNDVIQNKYRETFFINVSNGLSKAFIKERGFAFDHKPSNNAIFYDSDTSPKEGNAIIVNLDTYLPIGDKVTVPINFGIHEIINFSDSAILVSSEGLHYLNFENGDSWSIHKNTGYKDAASTILKGIAGIALGVATGFYVIPIASDVVYGIVSNVLLDGDFLYYSSRNSIIKADLKGNVIWEVKNLAKGKSTLIKNENHVFLIDHGFAFKNSYTAKVSESRLWALDKDNGMQISYTNFANGDILDTCFDDEYIYLLQKNTIAVYSLEKKKTSKYLQFPTKIVSDRFWRFENDTYFEWKDGIMKKLSDSYNSTFVIQGYDGDDVILMDDELRVINIKKRENLYRYVQDLEDLRVFQANNQLIFSNEDFEVLAELPAPNNFYIEDYKVYSSNEINIWVSDISSLFPDFQSFRE